jgi:hypothetical protein
MAIGVPGEEIVPIVTADVDQLSITPTVAAGASSTALIFNNAYQIFVDNAGVGGNSTRLWLDTPNDGELVLGPRAGADNLGQVRIRHDKISGVLGVVLRQDSGGILYLTSSSRRYKVGITDHELDLDALRQIRSVRFRDLTGIKDAAIAAAEARGEVPTDADVEAATEGASWYYGAIAEEVHELGLTELVTYEDDPDHPGRQRPNGLRYELFGLAAMQLVRDQAARIDALEARLAALEGAH